MNKISQKQYLHKKGLPIYSCLILQERFIIHYEKEGVHL